LRYAALRFYATLGGYEKLIVIVSTDLDPNGSGLVYFWALFL
jgi:hypothetical protein